MLQTSNSWSGVLLPLESHSGWRKSENSSNHRNIHTNIEIKELSEDKQSCVCVCVCVCQSFLSEKEEQTAEKCEQGPNGAELLSEQLLSRCCMSLDPPS